MQKVKIGTQQRLIKYVRKNGSCRISDRLFHELFPVEVREAIKYASRYKAKLNFLDKLQRRISRREAFLYHLNGLLIDKALGIEPHGPHEYIVSDWS